MGIEFSIFLIGAGAILLWAVSASVAGVSLDIVGLILMIVGAVGLAAALLAAGRRETPRRRY